MTKRSINPMPKSLYLLRHAQATSGRISLHDLDRSLSKRGIKDTNKLAHKLAKIGLTLDLILVSPSVRTMDTGNIIARGLHIPNSHFIVSEDLYEANPMTLLKVISAVPRRVNRLMIVGHNPGFTNLASILADESVSMSTCSLIKLSFAFKNWHEIFSQRASKFKFLN
jgi:phosphohistidine phosphatase